MQRLKRSRTLMMLVGACVLCLSLGFAPGCSTQPAEVTSEGSDLPEGVEDAAAHDPATEGEEATP